MKPPISRRSFVAAGVTAAAVPSHAASSEWLYFEPEEVRLLDALCAQIIPADEDPGAREADVPRYIDRQLTGPLKRFAPFYRNGLPALDAACRKTTGRSFLDLDFEAQTAFLDRVDKNDVQDGGWVGQSAASFFQMVVDHTMQGFYGSPRHGGNKDEASWKMLGIAQHMGHGPHGHGSGEPQ
ncbi:MAG: gluconate 2-dehydrogenase subunit 3 family protein [Bryobacteraceae bacterium]